MYKGYLEKVKIFKNKFKRNLREMNPDLYQSTLIHTIQQ